MRCRPRWATRLNLTYDVVYFLVRSRNYYFDLNSIRLPHRSTGSRRARSPPSKPPKWAGPLAGTQAGLSRARPAGLQGHWLGKNPGDVWDLPTRGFRGVHFATFPEALVERPLLATCPRGSAYPAAVRGGGAVAYESSAVGSRRHEGERVAIRFAGRPRVSWESWHQADPATELCAEHDFPWRHGPSALDGQPSSIHWLNTAFWAEQSKHRLQLARGTYAERRASKMVFRTFVRSEKRLLTRAFRRWAVLGSNQ
jgi:hypothetical protein